LHHEAHEAHEGISRNFFVNFVAFVVAIFLSTAALLSWDRGNLQDYKDRRAKLASQIGDGVVVLFGYTEAETASSITRFKQNEAFYYLTGWNEPGAMILLAARGGALEKDGLYIPGRDPVNERWNGPKLFPESPDALTRTGFAAVRGTPALHPDLLDALKSTPRLFTELTPQPESGEQTFIAEVVAKLKAMAPLATLLDVRPMVQTMRAVKSQSELALIRKATENSIEAHLSVMKALKPGMWEYEIAALLKYEWDRRGSEWASYPPIVGSGFFSTVLHYSANDRQTEAGDLVVIDAAGSYSGYTSDITRTLPVSGRFTARQREIYEIVRAAQAAAISAAKPGAILGRGQNTLYQVAYNYINTHGKDLKGQPLGQYFIHGLGHPIGLNVHDPMDTVNVPLAPGMIVTIEPGIYIPEEKLGVRIEDVILITRDGNEVLTKRLPSEPGAVERMMN
jgi:Xaa-Pro aminopeptidase